MSQRRVLFGASLGQWNGADAGNVPGILEIAAEADRGGLDVFTIADHLYFGGKLDAYSVVGFVLGRTTSISGAVTVSNLPTRPAPALARTITSLSALSGGRVILGVGAGAIWDMIPQLGVPRLTPGAAVRAMEEAIALIRSLCGGGEPVTFDGSFYQVAALQPSPIAAPPIWTGSVGPRSLAVTGRAADGWVPSMGSDWLSLRYRESRPVIDEAARAAGRDPAEIADVFNFGGRITSAPLAETRDEDGRWIGGSPEQWIEEMTAAVLVHRAGGFIFRSTDEDTPAAVAVARFAQEIVPAVREAAAKALPPRAAFWPAGRWRAVIRPALRWPAAVAAPCGATSLRRERLRDSPHPPQRSWPRRPGQYCAEPVPSQTGRRKAQTACRNTPPRSPRKSGAESAEVPNLLQVKLDVRACASSELCRYMCR